MPSENEKPNFTFLSARVPSPIVRDFIIGNLKDYGVVIDKPDLGRKFRNIGDVDEAIKTSMCDYYDHLIEFPVNPELEADHIDAIRIVMNLADIELFKHR
ncbi:MAG: hypothetical protein DRO99_03955 [Candidatus Aenigmatarchaeota archaeon]|nr:MAG: hypothetical protein DRO99_03955 [Candidatus Aenigmarchaeota archaeon]